MSLFIKLLTAATDFVAAAAAPCGSYRCRKLHSLSLRIFLFIQLSVCPYVRVSQFSVLTHFCYLPS